MSAVVALRADSGDTSTPDPVTVLMIELRAVKAELRASKTATRDLRRGHAATVADLVADLDAARAETTVLEARLHNLRREQGIAE